MVFPFLNAKFFGSVYNAVAVFESKTYIFPSAKYSLFLNADCGVRHTNF